MWGSQPSPHDNVLVDIQIHLEWGNTEQPVGPHYLGQGLSRWLGEIQLLVVLWCLSFQIFPTEFCVVVSYTTVFQFSKTVTFISHCKMELLRNDLTDP